jgi:quercetin dioxygenase-like cupin family protein
MAFTPVPFESIPWSAGGHPLERKKIHPERPVVLLEFAPGFADPKWCERAHVLLVLEGALELELADGVARLSAGACGVVDGGTRHRARNPGHEPCVVFVVSDVEMRERGSP